MRFESNDMSLMLFPTCVQCAAMNDHTPHEDYKYWEDAVSANFDADDTFFKSFQTFHLEWQPGELGY